MKRLELLDLLARIYGPPRYGLRFEFTRTEPVEAPEIRRQIDAVIERFRTVELSDGETPHVWLQVPRETLDECRADLGDEDEEELQVWYELEMAEDLWLRISPIDDELDGGLAMYPTGTPILYNRRSGELFAPSPWTADRREAFVELLSWLGEEISQAIEDVITDPDAYHSALEARLPRSERLGWLRRDELWAALPEAEHFIYSELSAGERERFASIQDFDGPPLASITANDYFGFVAICYRGAGYEQVADLTPRDQYDRLADGRHVGLLDIDPDSPEAMQTWLTSGSRAGGHPWEIARGGNRTHISLYVEVLPEGYRLRLAGSAASRTAETIQMALALHDAGVPLEVHDLELLQRRARGEDLIAVVPSAYHGAYPHTIRSLFPDDVNVHDHMPNYRLDEDPGLEDYVRWIPLPKLVPRQA